jgi:hypothetical protein
LIAEFVPNPSLLQQEERQTTPVFVLGQVKEAVSPVCHGEPMAPETTRADFDTMLMYVCFLLF